MFSYDQISLNGTVYGLLNSKYSTKFYIIFIAAGKSIMLPGLNEETVAARMMVISIMFPKGQVFNTES